MHIRFEMAMACVTIAVIILIMALMFALKKQNSYAVTILPLTIVPIFFLLEGYFSERIASINKSISPQGVQIGIIAFALITAFILIGLLSKKIKSKSRRLTTILLSGIFSIIFSWVFIINIF